LLPPPVDSVSLSIVPPNVNDGAGPAVSSSVEVTSSAIRNGPCSAKSAETLSCFEAPGSFAGAGALAAPDPKPADLAGETGAFCGGATGSRLATPGSSISSKTISGVEVGAEAVTLAAGLTLSLVTAEAAIVGTAGAGGAQLTTQGFGEAGPEAAAGVTRTGLAGVGVACFAGAGVAAVVDFVVSFLRNSPRATRNVPFACSTLMGLVRTRLAPMRKAFATPACPSTTATARADWLFAVLRALLNSNVAFCSLSQSTTTASKCSPINFLTAAKGSVQGITVKSNSPRTCVTVRAVFSSGQNKSA